MLSFAQAESIRDKEIIQEYSTGESWHKSRIEIILAETQEVRELYWRNS